jgi:hypothetical protein
MLRPWIFGVLLCSVACTPFATGASVETDASTDGGAEASTFTEAGGPVLDAATDAPSTPCSAPHFFCEDFDGPSSWPGWTRVEAAGSPIVADIQLFASPPASMHVTVNGGFLGSDHPSYLHRPFQPAQHIVVKANVAVSLSGSPDPTSEIDVVTLELAPPTGFERYFVGLVLLASGGWILETEVATDETDNVRGREPIAPVGSGFTTVTLDLDLTAGSVRGAIGNTGVTTKVASAEGKGHDLKIGAAWANNTTGSYAVNIDDVTLDQ